LLHIAATLCLCYYSAVKKNLQTLKRAFAQHNHTDVVFTNGTIEWCGFYKKILRFSLLKSIYTKNRKTIDRFLQVTFITNETEQEKWYILTINQNKTKIRYVLTIIVMQKRMVSNDNNCKTKQKWYVLTVIV
jgi:hypothetical protein